MQTPGICDVIAALPSPRSKTTHDISGILLCWEVKAAGGVLSEPQIAFKDAIRDIGSAHVQHVVGPFDALLGWLQEWGYVLPASLPHYRRTS
jgi:hypothetical protein